MPYEKSYIFTTRRTLLIIVGVILALIVTLKSNGFIALDSSPQINKLEVTHKQPNGLRQWITNFKSTEIAVPEHPYTQILKN